MDEIKNMLRSMQEEMKQQKLDIKEMKEDIKNTISTCINEKLKSLESQNEKLEQKIDIQQTAINNFERYIRRKNLLFFGVEEREGSYRELEEKIRDIINNTQKNQMREFKGLFNGKYCRFVPLLSTPNLFTQQLTVFL